MVARPCRDCEVIAMGKRYEIHVLVGLGNGVGAWAPLPRWFDNEPAAMRAVEEHRALDRAASGWAKSYRVIESTLPVDVPVLRQRVGVR